jgi:hypothetical protein
MLMVVPLPHTRSMVGGVESGKPISNFRLLILLSGLAKGPNVVTLLPFAASIAAA